MTHAHRVRAALVGLAALLSVQHAVAGAADFEFHPVSVTVRTGSASELAVRLVDKRSGMPVSGAAITSTRLDMSPDSMAEMLAPHEAIKSEQLGVFRFKANLTMAGRWAFKLQASVPGEAETIAGIVVIQAQDAPDAKASAASKADRKVLYYRNPMGLADTSPTPKKDWMGMDYIPVYEGEDDGGSTVKISLDKVQRAGVRTEEVRMVALARPVRAPAIAKPDERTLRVVTLRADAYIEKLYVNETGRHVAAGEPLFRVYGPDLLRALIDYRTSSPTGLISAEQKLQILDIPKAAIAAAKHGDRVESSFDFPSPASGVIMEKMVVEGMMMRAGEPLYRLADLSSIWVIADVSEQDLGLLKEGDQASVSFRGLPGETYEGRVTFILHELDAASRTGKVRIEIKNPGYRIRHEMYADATIRAGSEGGERLAVPASAVIDSGTRQIVLVERGEGRFEPRQVKLGVRGDGLIEIRDGLKAGERIVVAANFLIDAESNLKAALASFTADGATGSGKDEHKGHKP